MWIVPPRKLWPGEVDALATRKEVRDTVVSCEQYASKFPPSPLAEFQAWLLEIVDKIPSEYRGTATIEFESSGGYEGSHCASVEIAYRRPETDEEWDARRRDVAYRLRMIEDAERMKYDELRARFGDQ